MNTLNNKNQLDRLVSTLMTAYRIDPKELTSDNQFVRKTTFEDEAKDWIQRTLLNPDERMAESILPILVERFEEHLKNCDLPYGK